VKRERLLVEQIVAVLEPKETVAQMELFPSTRYLAS
jgi:hypothetical protein